MKIMKSRALNLVWKRFKSWIHQPAATVEYPFVHRHAHHNARISLRNNFAECIGCHKCEQACPVQCISIVSEPYPEKDKAPRTSRGVVFENWVTSFKIDFSTCVSCGICVDVCPTGSLTNDKSLTLPRQDQRHLILDLAHKPRALRREQGYED